MKHKSVYGQVYFKAEYANFLKEKRGEENKLIGFEEEEFSTKSKKEALKRAKEVLDAMNKGLSCPPIEMFVELVRVSKVKPVFVADDCSKTMSQYHQLRLKKIEEL